MSLSPALSPDGGEGSRLALGPERILIRFRVSFLSPSPLWGEGWGEGWRRRPRRALRPGEGPGWRALGRQALGDLDDAARVGGDDGLGAGGADIGHLAHLQALRHLRLGQVVRPGRPAAPIRLGQWHHGQSGNLSEESSWLAADLLAV